jgi:hypothetical protein
MGSGQDGDHRQNQEEYRPKLGQNWPIEAELHLFVGFRPSNRADLEQELIIK